MMMLLTSRAAFNPENVYDRLLIRHSRQASRHLNLSHILLRQLALAPLLLTGSIAVQNPDEDVAIDNGFEGCGESSTRIMVSFFMILR